MSENNPNDIDQTFGRLTRRTFLVNGGIALAATQIAAAQSSSQIPRSIDGCPFCRIVAGTLASHKLWEDREFLAFLDNKPINPGHILLIPKPHYEYLFEMPESNYERMLKRARKLAIPLKKAMDAKRIGVIVEGFGVAHCHIHLVPINNGGELIKKGITGVTDEEYEKVAKRIRPFFKNI